MKITCMKNGAMSRKMLQQEERALYGSFSEAYRICIV